MKDKYDQVKVKKWRCPNKAIKKSESKKHDERKERHNDNDPKSLKSWDILWAYKSLYFITNNHSLFNYSLIWLDKV